MRSEKGLLVEDSVREAYCWYLRSRLKAPFDPFFLLFLALFGSFLDRFRCIS